MNKEPFEGDQLTDAELDRLLRKWDAPPVPARLRAAIFPDSAGPWWRRAWRGSLRVPIPVAAALAFAAALGVWQGSAHRPAPRELVRTERVEVPVWKDRVVVKTVYLRRAAPEAELLKPVSELKPRIVQTPDE
ncbi:MAG TPA: hypothetical protein VMU19_01825 [Bryobacteraceae bacterium]|nr:hypothetical protein [Bryobacteraceae bacterium]